MRCKTEFEFSRFKPKNIIPVAMSNLNAHNMVEIWCHHLSYFDFMNFSILSFKWHLVCHDWFILKFWSQGVLFYRIPQCALTISLHVSFGSGNEIVPDLWILSLKVHTSKAVNDVDRCVCCIFFQSIFPTPWICLENKLFLCLLSAFYFPAFPGEVFKTAFTVKFLR